MITGFSTELCLLLIVLLRLSSLFWCQLSPAQVAYSSQTYFVKFMMIKL